MDVRRSLAALTVALILGCSVGCGSDSGDSGPSDVSLSSESGDPVPFEVSFSLDGPFDPVGGVVTALFTASGAAVDDGVLCESGTATDAGSLGDNTRVLGYWMMECDDGSGSFTLELVSGTWWESDGRPRFRYEWEVKEGSGDYGGMSGWGTGTADCGEDECRDEYEGTVQWGATPASPVTTSASAAEATATSYDAATVFEEWSIPEAACLRTADDPGLLATAVDEAAERVERLAGRYASGWPTTTMQTPDEFEEWTADILRSGIQALALAMLADSEEAVLQRWGQYEASYADRRGQWGPISTISSRVDDWVAPAHAVVGAVRDACADL
jgi:hypothetical protein